MVVIDARTLEHLPPFVAAMTREASGCGFILVCSTLAPTLMLEGMRAGIRECVAEPIDPVEFEAAVSRAAAEGATDGRVFAFVGAKGGVGTTTTAVNVAIELSRAAPRRTLLMDLHMSNGDAGLFLGEEPRFSVADAIENVHRLDEGFLRSLVVHSKLHLDLLASADSAIRGPVESGRIRSLVEFAKRHYRYTVLDVPRSEPAALEALEPTAWIVIVANQELATVKNAGRMAASLRLRYGKERVVVAVARHDGSAGIGRADIERAVGVKVKYVAAVRLPARGRGAQQRPAGEPGQPLRAGRLVPPDRGRPGRPAGLRRRAQVVRRLPRPAERTAQLSGRTDMVMTTTTPPAVDARHPEYQEIKSRVHQGLLNRLNLERLTRTRREEAEPEIRGLVADMLEAESDRTPLSLFERQALTEDVLNELFGLGPLESLLADPEISDILVNRFDQVYVERHGLLEPVGTVFKDDAHLMRIIERIVSSVGRRIDESSPMVDARLADGSRVNAIIPPLALDGPVLSIRRFRTDKLGAADFVERDSLTQPMLDFIHAAVSARLNVIVSGGTGAGKTTLLNMLSGFISDKERIVTIEDAAELTLRQRHVVRLETRAANIEGKGAVRQRQLVINALRMRPDRIIVGEVRGDEALDMLQAMNTGHDGSLTTVHANSARDALHRLDTMVAMANLNIPERAVRQQIVSAVQLVVHVSRMADGTRKVTSITEITGMEGEMISMQDIFLFDRTGISAEGRVCGRFRASGIRPRCSERLATAGHKLPMDMFEHVKVIG